MECSDAQLAICLLGSAEFGGEVEQRPAWDRVREVLNELREQVVDALRRDELDTAARLLDDIGRIDPELVHADDLHRLRSKRLLQKIKIAVLHHPVSPLPFTEVARFAGLLNAGETKDALLAGKYCLVLHGHLHSGWFAAEQWPARHQDHTLRIAAAPTLGSREQVEHLGFNEVLIFREGTECQIEVRRFGREGATWSQKATMGPFEPGT